MDMKIVLLTSSVLFLSFVALESYKPRIAIIGAGIGGTSCAYFLNKDLGDSVNIDVYEANEIGGRLATVGYEGEVYEVGGSIIHERNQYMNSFRDEFDLLNRPKTSDNESFGFYDGKNFQFVSSKSHFINLIRMMWKYGYLPLRRLRMFVENMLTQFDAIYQLQKMKKSFTTVAELFREATNEEFMTYFNITAAEGFLKHAEVNEPIIHDLIKGSLRVNYGQSFNVPLFVGAVSVAGMFGSLWSVKNGNKQIPEFLLKYSNSTLLHRLVTKVKRDSKADTYILESITAENNFMTRSYDFVIIANPITSDSRTPIEFLQFHKPIKVPGRYQRTVVTLVSGELNKSYFQTNQNLPDLIINNDENGTFNSIGLVEAVDGDKGMDVHKIFSKTQLSYTKLEKMFLKRGFPKIIDWLAYPQYENLGLTAGNFVLHDKLFYVNAIEWAASAMEMSVIGAKNVALLVQYEIMKNMAILHEKLEDRKVKIEVKLEL